MLAEKFLLYLETLQSRPDAGRLPDVGEHIAAYSAAASAPEGRTEGEVDDRFETHQKAAPPGGLSSFAAEDISRASPAHRRDPPLAKAGHNRARGG